MDDLPIGLELRPQDILIESGLADYNHGISFIYMYLQRLNTNIYLIEKILSFPRVFLTVKPTQPGIYSPYFLKLGRSVRN